MSKNTLISHLGIQFTHIGEDFIEATMPVDHRTHQPAGLLHGGASAVLAETLGSVASSLVVGWGEKLCVGIELNASHLNGIRSGTVLGRVSPIRIGKSVHVWEIQIKDATEDSKGIICISRLTVLVKEVR